MHTTANDVYDSSNTIKLWNGDLYEYGYQGLPLKLNKLSINIEHKSKI